MKRFLKKRFLGIPMLVILVVALVGIVALAVAGTIHLTSTGEVEVLPTPDYSYTVDTQELAFGDHIIVEGIAFEASATIAIVNTGNRDIKDWGIVLTNPPLPDGVTMTFDGWDVLIPVGQPGSITFIARIVNPQVGTYDLSKIEYDLTPFYSP